MNLLVAGYPAYHAAAAAAAAGVMPGGVSASTVGVGGVGGQPQYIVSWAAGAGGQPQYVTSTAPTPTHAPSAAQAAAQQYFNAAQAAGKGFKAFELFPAFRLKCKTAAIREG